MSVHQAGVSLGSLRGKLSRLAKTGRAPLELNRNLAQEARKLVYDEFRQGRDPYGTPWAPTERGGVILRKTGRLANSLRPRASITGFNITTPVVYAAAHLYGARYKSRAVMNQTLQFNKKGRFATRRQRIWNSVKVKPYTKGSYNLVPRPFLPYGSRGLGPIWTAAFKRVINSYVRVFMKAH